jgi:hypothetical protein
VGDAPVLPALLQQIPQGKPIESVSANGADDTQGCHEAIAAREATAVLSTRKNARLWKRRTAGAQARNEILRATQRLGRRIWKCLERLPPAQPHGNENEKFQVAG